MEYTDSMSHEVDLSGMTLQQTKEALGELVRMSLQARKAVVLILRKDGQLASIDPSILDAVPDCDLIPFILSWPDSEIQSLLERRARDEETRKQAKKA